jgi:hypothetical protein
MAQNRWTPGVRRAVLGGALAVGLVGGSVGIASAVSPSPSPSTSPSQPRSTGPGLPGNGNRMAPHHNCPHHRATDGRADGTTRQSGFVAACAA